MNNDAFLFFIGLILGLILATLITIGISNGIWKHGAVKHGHAEYNSGTGVWQWKECGHGDQ